MSLENVVLGLLARRPAHGYRLRARLEAELRARRPVQATHVYALLARLERAGLVAGRAERDARGRDRRVYAVTDAGRARHLAWLAAPDATGAPLRRPLLLKAAVLLHLGAHLGRRTLAVERAPRLRWLRDRESAPDLLGRLLRDRERAHLEVELWLLEQLAAEPPTPRRSGSASR